MLLLYYQTTKDVESHVRMGRLHFVEFPASDRKKYGAAVSTVIILKLHDNKKKSRLTVKTKIKRLLLKHSSQLFAC